MLDYGKRVTAILRALKTAELEAAYPIRGWKYRTCGYELKRMAEEEADDWELFPENGTWGASGHVCFYTEFSLPEAYEGKHVVIRVDTQAVVGWNVDNPQFLVYLDGRQICGLDVNHAEFDLSEAEKSKTVHTLRLYAYVNHGVDDVFLSVNAYILNSEARTLGFDLWTALESAMMLPEDGLERIELLKKLNTAVNCLDMRKPGSEAFFQSVKEAHFYMMEEVYGRGDQNKEIEAHCIGHTHIDVAWRWPLRQTREKAVRSFSTVIRLMEKYPEYRFMSSQPQLYQFVKEDCPELYEKIKEKIREGVWEPEGAMWVEPDCNLTSGESLVRQLIYGKRFFREEFGKDNEVLWLPDVFGYSASMPQILKKAGVNYFMTTKISWNEYNRIPNDTMMWRGIDGTEILTYFITTPNICSDEERRPGGFFATYNGGITPAFIEGAWERYQNKDINTEILTCFGHGDGGGGATSEMLEVGKRLEYGLPGVPAVRQTFSGEFFRELEKRLEKERLPRWVGELYLEFHRATYTSMGRNKRYNRLCEFKNTDAEFLSALALWNGGVEYPEEELRHVWEITLLNQFHDILPGSSIKEVYDDSREQFEEILGLTGGIIENGMAVLAGGIHTGRDSVVVVNTAGVRRDAIAGLRTDEPVAVYEGGVKLPGQMGSDGIYRFAAQGLPQKGYRIYELKKESEEESGSLKSRITVTPRTIDTPYYHILVDEDGYFTSIYDREEDRELVQKGKRANVFQVFEDRPWKYEAWNLDEFYTEKMWEVTGLEEWTVTESGPVRTCIRTKRHFSDSEIIQTIIFYTGSKRIDFQTKVDWNESQLFLKTAFPLDIMADKGVFEIQYGNVERMTHRNTSWDRARFEVCAHKWADLAENGYGAALLNDCKYGYDVLDSVMRLSLIKSGVDPNPEADREVHEFTYAFYPHSGDFREGHVIMEAYDLNCPVYTAFVRGTGQIDSGINETPPFSFVSSSLENVVIEVVKKAEESDDLIVRMYEAYGRRCRPVISLSTTTPASVWECDLLERDCCEIELNQDGKSFMTVMMPYEIKTLKLKKEISNDRFI